MAPVERALRRIEPESKRPVGPKRDQREPLEARPKEEESREEPRVPWRVSTSQMEKVCRITRYSQDFGVDFLN